MEEEGIKKKGRKKERKRNRRKMKEL